MYLDTATPQLVARATNGIGELVLNNPERRNALTDDMMQAIPTVLAALVDEREVRVVVISGAGGRAFASGVDVTSLERLPAGSETLAEFEALYRAALVAVRELPVPVIAMIDGYCLGGGLQVALAADLRIASSASAFGIPAARLGLAYQSVGPLVDLVGGANAADILYTARRFSAHEAEQMGLVNRVVEQHELEPVVLGEVARAIADNAPLSIRAARVALREHAKPEHLRSEQAVRATVDACNNSEDLIEGKRAFRERRQPEFHGR
jgi:enoyl-CoA hydratase